MSRHLTGSLRAVVTDVELLRREMLILDRLLYKNKTQHLRARYYKKLKEVSKFNKRIVNASSVGTQDLPFFVNVYNTLCRALVAACNCSKLLRQLLSQGYFMPFALVSLAIVSRLYALHRTLLARFTAAISDAASHPDTPPHAFSAFKLVHQWKRCLDAGKEFEFMSERGLISNPAGLRLGSSTSSKQALVMAGAENGQDKVLMLPAENPTALSSSPTAPRFSLRTLVADDPSSDSGGSEPMAGSGCAPEHGIARSAQCQQSMKEEAPVERRTDDMEGSTPTNGPGKDVEDSRQGRKMEQKSQKKKKRKRQASRETKIKGVGKMNWPKGASALNEKTKVAKGSKAVSLKRSKKKGQKKKAKNKGKKLSDIDDIFSMAM